MYEERNSELVGLCLAGKSLVITGWERERDIEIWSFLSVLSVVLNNDFCHLDRFFCHLDRLGTFPICAKIGTVLNYHVLNLIFIIGTIRVSSAQQRLLPPR